MELAATLDGIALQGGLFTVADAVAALYLGRKSAYSQLDAAYGVTAAVDEVQVFLAVFDDLVGL